MAKACYVCGKTSSQGMQISHSHRRSKRSWSPNLQSFRAKIDGQAKSVQVCAKCIKAGKLVKAS